MEKEKVVCYCMNVTEQEVKEAITQGAQSFEEIQDTTGVGTGCGRCIERVKTLVKELLGQ